MEEAVKPAIAKAKTTKSRVMMRRMKSPGKNRPHSSSLTDQKDLLTPYPNSNDGGEVWPALTGLRGLAALAVLLLHAYILGGQPASLSAPVRWLLGMGWSGVDVFFVLSAFLLSLPFLRAQAAGQVVSLRRYFWRRALRILPAYYAQIVVLLLAGALGASWAWREPTMPSVLAHGLLWLNAWPLVHPQVPLWWTLPVEAGFYLLLPWFARLLRPGRWQWLLVFIVLSQAWRAALMHAGLTRVEEIAWVEHLPGRLDQFLVGMLTAYFWTQRSQSKSLPSSGRADATALVSMLIFLALPAIGLLIGDRPFEGAPVTSPWLLAWHLYAAVAVATLLFALASGAPRLGRLLAAAPLRFLGTISFSLYLWHYPVLLALRDTSGGYAAVRADFWPYFWPGLLFSVLVAAISWWCVERPAQLWGRRVKLTT
jgi:peptidoglycan/LPS O-acetylase OafA/YrhL